MLNGLSLVAQQMGGNDQSPLERLLGVQKPHEDGTVFAGCGLVLLVWYTASIVFLFSMLPKVHYFSQFPCA